jgi:predicted nucleic acid-binding protein
MKIYCLDTSAYSKFKAGQAQVVDVITQCHTLKVPVVVLGELRSGFRLGSRYEKNESELKMFLSNPVVRIVDVDDAASHHYSEIVSELRQKGTPISTNDIWIAAIAMREGATVLTFDSHFHRIGQLAVLCFSDK